MKYSFLMPYHMRAEQLRHTLESFKRLYSGRNDFEVIIVEDTKSFMVDLERTALRKVVLYYKYFFPISIITNQADSCNPARAYNLGGAIADGGFLILTNPECYHAVDVLAGLDQEFDIDMDSYVLCSCLHVNKAGDDVGWWYQHSLYRNVGLHFCSAISTHNYDGVGGFDEGYGEGVCFEDDDFRDRVIDYGLKFVYRDDLVVVHQKHGKSKPDNYLVLHHINKSYHKSKWGSKVVAENKKPVPGTIKGGLV